MPMQYTAIFHGCKNVNFHLKNFDFFFIFLLETKIVCTRKNRVIGAVLTCTHNQCFEQK